MTEPRSPDAPMPDRAKIGRRLAGIAAALGLLALAEWIADLPLIGAAVAEWLNSRLQGEQNPFAGIDAAALTQWGRIIGGQAARRIATLFFALLIVFFVLCESDSLLQQVKAVGHRL